jgi:hypothetical protein
MHQAMQPDDKTSSAAIGLYVDLSRFEHPQGKCIEDASKVAYTASANWAA